MAKVSRIYDFENGTRTDAEQVDEEFDNLVKGINDLDDEMANKVDILGDFKGTWNGIPFRDADPGMAGRVAEIENMVKNEEKATVTLVRGENTITVPENATFSPIEVLGDELKNILPPFDSGEWSGASGFVTVNGPNKVSITANGNTLVYAVHVPVKPGSTYFITGKRSSTTGTFIDVYSGGGLDTNNAPEQFTVPQGVATVQVRCIVDKQAQGMVVFEDVMIIEGNTEREYVLGYQPVRNPYIEVDNGSFLYFDEYLFKGDKIYQTPNGEWRKKQNKIESLLTPENVKNPRINTSYTGGKGLLVPTSEIAPGIDASTVEVIKFNGKYFQRTDSPSNITNDKFYLYEDSFILFLSSADTGWGDSITPSKLEILAVLLGWKMNNGTYGTNYNGTGTKTWIPRKDVNNTRATTSAPTALASDAKYIKIIYKTSSEQDVAAKYEGALRLVKGANKVTLGEGIVVRERVYPKKHSSIDYYFINNGSHASIASSVLKNKVKKWIAIYRNCKEQKIIPYVANGVSGWMEYPDSEGNYDLRIHTSLFDPSAIYTATYKILERHSFSCYVGDVQAKHTTNFHMENNEQVKSIEEIKKKLSQYGLVVVDRLGKKDGIGLLDSKGRPIRADGTPVELKRQVITWSDKATIVPSNNTYTKKITMPANAYLYRLFMFYNEQLNYVMGFEWNKDLLQINNNVPYVVYSQGVIGFPKKFTNGGPLFEFNNRTLFNANDNPFRYKYVRNTGSEQSYIEYWGVNEDGSELELRWKNPHPSANDTLQIDVIIEVVTQ